MINAHCFEPGTITIGGRNQVGRDGFDRSGAYAAYEITTPEALQKTASRYDFVVRPNGKKIQGAGYSSRMAANDFKFSR